MTKYTTTSLIEILEEFPEDLPIETELALLWNYPDDLRNEMGNMSNEEFLILTQENATDLCIFEGSWEKGNVSDVDGKFKEFYTDQKEPEPWYIKLKNKILRK